MISTVEKWRQYCQAYRANPSDYTAQDGYVVEALGELLAEIDFLNDYIADLNRLNNE